MISTGGNDKCVFVWATDFGNVEEPVHDDEEP